MSHHFRTSKEQMKHLPINLARKAQREQRIQNGGIGRNRKKNRRKKRNKRQEFESRELDALVAATENQLKTILEDELHLSDIPNDVTPEELQGELALAQGGGTTIYVQRDGLSTLTVVLPQEKPTIAQLKRAIAAQARVQQTRELRERYEERLKRRGLISELHQTIDVDGLVLHDRNEEHHNSQQQQQQQTHKQVNKTTSSMVVSHIMEHSKPTKSNGELVCSETYNGHRRHRPNVSWRFLWRAYILYNIDTGTLINDENGRKSLKECGIENAQTLKFYKREKYFGRKRQ